MRSFIVTTHGTERVRPISLLKGEETTVEFDFGPACGALDALIDTATWTSDNGSASVGTVTTGDTSTSAPLTANSVGESLIKCVAVIGTDTLVRSFLVCVSDPTTQASDYA